MSSSSGSATHGSRMRLFAVLSLTMTLVGATTRLEAQEAMSERNVNVLGGPTSLELELAPDGTVRIRNIFGNPWRNPVVEPACATSSRNPAVIFCSGVDYRLVDVEGVGDRVHPDSFNMIAQSIDGGVTWASTLHPGYPGGPDFNVLSQYDFAADPIVSAGAAGMPTAIPAAESSAELRGTLITIQRIRLEAPAGACSD